MSFGLPVTAGPTDQDPDVPLNVRPENEDTVGKAVVEERAHREELQDVLTKARAGKWANSFPATIREAHIAARQLDRLGGRLIIAGEPAGADLKARAAYLQRLVGDAVKAARGIPIVSTSLSRDKKTAMSMAEARAKRIPSITALTKKDRWEEAEENLYDQVDEISSMALWYYTADRQKMLSPFEETRKAIDEEMARRRTEVAQQAMQAEIEARLPDLDGLVARVKTAAEAVAADGMADVNDKMLNGPQLFEHFGEQWKQTEVVLMQCRAMNLARGGAPDGETLPAADELLERVPEFSGQMAQALTALIEADASQALEAEARELYVAYLPAVGLVNTLTFEGELAEAAAPALDKLAGRSSVLAAEVQSYRAATDDLLRWRRRIVQAYADREEEEYPPSVEQVIDASTNEETLRNAIPGTKGRSHNIGVYEYPVWSMIETISPKLIGEPVRSGNLRGLSTSSKIAVDPFSDHTLVQCAVANHFDAELGLLKTGLLIDETSPPLSLAAATAVATAERGDLVAVGGTIEQVAVDAVIPRFRDLSGVLWPLALSDLESTEAMQVNPLHQILFRFPIKPVWLQHEYLFVRVEQENEVEQ